jgi:ABC-type polysaccharide transport system permease subunit
MNYTYILPALLSGLLVITLIDSIGALASRKLHFNYAWLSVSSFLVYTFIGYFVSNNSGLLMALLVNNAIGLYDATVGLRLSMALKANYILREEDKKYLSTETTEATMFIIVTALAFIGYFIAWL